MLRHYVAPMGYWPPIHKHHGILVEAYKLEHDKRKRTKEGQGDEHQLVMAQALSSANGLSFRNNGTKLVRFGFEK